LYQINPSGQLIVARSERLIAKSVPHQRHRTITRMERKVTANAAHFTTNCNGPCRKLWRVAPPGPAILVPGRVHEIATGMRLEPGELARSFGREEDWELKK
jgi:hypothetical protein